MEEVNEIPADLRLRLGRVLRDQAIAIEELRALAGDPDEGADLAPEWVN